ncbi:MAG: efflux RND transporter periplasmic adaptor subunit [Polyangiaceae bacterium]|nr:efflux RND transporter periplasmic adaptor subunit [Polyangiaceae bacterium]MCB9605683.1 efflux RND transporter periplasmic adaptor subunit [Polyangiaceae bacterium]
MRRGGRPIVSAGTALVLLLACNPAAEHAGHDDHGSATHGSAGTHGKGEAHREGEAHGDGESHGAAEPLTVHLTGAAVKRLGIKSQELTKRELFPDSRIPAEVEIQPSGIAHVALLVPGRFTDVKVNIGDEVKPKDLLGTVVSSDASRARSELGQASARLKAAKTTLARERKLAAAGVSSEQAVVDAEARVSELQAQTRGLRRELGVLSSGGGGQLRLTAPIAGVIVALHATVGENVGTDEPAFTIADPTKVWVRGNVPELELERVKLGANARVRLHALPEVELAGKVTYVAPALDETTRALPIHVQLSEPDPRLKSGMFGSIELGLESAERVWALPSRAVINVQGETGVFVATAAPTEFQFHAVELGAHAGEYYELIRGLEPKHRVVVQGAFALKSVLQAAELGEGHAH